MTSSEHSTPSPAASATGSPAGRPGGATGHRDADGVEVASWTDDEGAQRATRLLQERLGVHADGVWAAPGRVNLIGEHLDYNGGSVLPMALPHSTYVAARARTDHRVRLSTADGDPTVWEGNLSDIGRDATVPAWVGYAAGSVRTLPGADAVTGFDAAIVSCVPLGAGLSSSAAIECAVALMLDDLFALGLDPAQLATACMDAENTVVGAPTGGMDQAASMLCREGHALHLDCATNQHEQVPLQLDAHDLAILVIDTQAHHSLVDGQYGARRAACEAVARREHLPTLGASSDPDGVLGRIADDTERRRVRHVFTEMARVEATVQALRSDRYDLLGGLLDASHVSMRDDYEISCPELDVAVEASRSAGALGARMTGGGFGGSAIALIHPGDRQGVEDAVTRAFASHGWTPPRFLLATPAPAARRV